MSERKMQKHLESKGYDTYNLDPTWVKHQKRTAFYNLPEERLNQLEEYLEDTYPESNPLKVLLAMDSKGLPDLICFKDDDILFIEVKNRGSISTSQIEWYSAFSELQVYVARFRKAGVFFYSPGVQQVEFTGDGIVESEKSFKEKIAKMENLFDEPNIEEINVEGYIPVEKR